MKDYYSFIEFYYKNNIPDNAKIIIPVRESFFGERFDLQMFFDNEEGMLSATDHLWDSALISAIDFKNYIDKTHKDECDKNGCFLDEPIVIHLFYADLYGHSNKTVVDFIYDKNENTIYFDMSFFS